MKEVFDFLKKTGTYYLATVQADGQPRVRPFGTILEYEGKLYIQTGKAKDVSKQLHANPKCEICAFDGEQWLRVACDLIEDERVEPKVAMLDAYPNLRAMYDPMDGNTEVFYMANAVATFSSFVAAPKEIRF